MIKSNELRIGNYVLDEHDSKQTVLTIENGPIIEEYNVTFRKYYYLHCDVKKLKPIPLTEKWLKDFGFKLSINKDSGCGHAIFREFNIWVDNGKLIYWKVKGSVELKHVHQLQNLYFALTGEELTKSQ